MFSAVKEKIFYWVFPPGIVNILKRIRNINLKYRALCRSNSRFKGIHQGERCFILCNGPSVKKQNLLLLKNEVVFSVASGYHHKDYLTIQPKYHCVPPYSYYKDLTYKDTVSWFREMEAKIGTAELYVGANQETLIRRNGLFRNHRVNYIYTGLLPKENDDKIVDISKKTPAIMSVPIMCIFIAMYMRFKEIYLIGVDNDWWQTGEYKHFFEPTVLRGKGDAADENGRARGFDKLFVQFYGFGDILKQYWLIHNRARANNISIYNATQGGAVEEFPRVRFESLFLDKSVQSNLKL